VRDLARKKAKGRRIMRPRREERRNGLLRE
jgi:hypothetical protein